VFRCDNDKRPRPSLRGILVQGTCFQIRPNMGSAKRTANIFDDFSHSLDVTGYGIWIIITGGWFGKQLVWKQIWMMAVNGGTFDS